MPEKNIVEKAIVPRNPSTAKVQNKDKYSLFAPLGGIRRVGIVGYSNDFSIDGNHFVSIRDGAITAAKIGDETITTPKIVNGAVTTQKIAPNAIDIARLDVGLQQLVNNAVRDVEYDGKTATLKFHRVAGDRSIDLPLESLFKDVKYDDVSRDLIITMWNGEVTTVPLDAIADRINAAALEVEANVDAKISPLEKVVEALLQEDVLLNQSIDELRGNDLDMETSGCYRTEEGIVLSDKMGKQVIIPLAFAAELNTILRAGQGIKLDYDAGAKKLTVSAMGGSGGSGGSGGGGTTVKVNGEAVSEFNADTKLDKVTNSNKITLYGDAAGKPYNYDLVPNEAKAWSVPQRGAGGIIYTGTPTADYHAATKKYVDDAITSRIGDIQSALEELHTYAQSLIGGNEE